jgi:hypothetical protein
MRNDQSDSSASSAENMGAGVFRISEFCKRNQLSNTKFHDLKKNGLGPCEMHYGKMIRITEKAEADWRAMMEKLATSKAAQLERARRTAQTSRAGKKSVEKMGKIPSPKGPCGPKKK